MKVSIIIPSLDGDRDGFTREALRSCQNQEGFTLGEDYEIILQQADEPVGKNINDGVAKAKGKYIKVMGDDDLLTPNCLRDLYEKAEEGFDFVCANAINFDMEGKEDLVCSDIPERVSDMILTNPIHGGTLFYRRETMLSYNEKMWTAEEFEHTLRSAAAGLRFGYVDKIVYRYRMHDSNKSGGGGWDSSVRSRLKRKPRYEFIYGPDGIVSKYVNNHSLINTNGH